VAFFEYSRHVFRRRFLLVMLSVPAFIFMMVLVVMVMVMIENRSQPWGFIDNADLFSVDQLNSLIDSKLVNPQTRELNTEAEAHQALMSGEIEVYFVIEDEYLETGRFD
jgi:flagellar basal body-associated protein FliL